MITVDQATERILAAIHPLPPERVPLGSALGRVLAEDVVAPFDLPPFANSAMDGYAVIAEDTLRAAAGHPARLAIVGDISAGASQLPSLLPGQAARITTGAPLPSGADAVVPVEHTSEPRDMAGSPLAASVDVLQPAMPDEYVRLPGMDISSGALAIEAGTVLRPAEIGLLAAMGVVSPLVRRQPLAGVLSTGSELVPVDQPLATGRIHDSNGPALAAAVLAAGGQVLSLGIAPDDPEIVASALDRGVQQGVDLLVTSAGVSVGARDYVRAAVERYGSIEFWQVNMRPGKPVAWGYYRGVPFFGLPGNPVSAQVGFEIFVRPALRRMAGTRALRPGRFPVRMLLAADSDGRESYLRAVVRQAEDGFVAELTGEQGSGVSSSMVRANALVIVPAGRMHVQAGSALEAMPLANFWEHASG
ncbi:MAG: molybdopterin molybdotransferase MoeA [Anaerolineales bacterium]|nr:molybdopterin molybdotransferase MoeA [Anaerolineales bacterium]